MTIINPKRLFTSPNIKNSPLTTTSPSNRPLAGFSFKITPLNYDVVDNNG